MSIYTISLYRHFGLVRVLQTHSSSHLDIFILLVTPFWISSNDTSKSCSTGGSCSFSFVAPLLPSPPPAEWDPTLKDWDRNGVREPKPDPRPPPRLNRESDHHLMFGGKKPCFTHRSKICVTYFGIRLTSFVPSYIVLALKVLGASLKTLINMSNQIRSFWFAHID